MRAPILLVALLLLATPSLGVVEILEADEATIQLTTRAEVTPIQEESGAMIDHIEARVSWLAKDEYNQEVLETTTTPEAMIGDEAVFSWEDPGFGTREAVIESTIKTNNHVTPVREENPFPIEGLDQELTQYTKPQEMTNTNEEIRRLASRLAGDKDDQYEVVFALADWVTTNIEYDLETITAEAVQTSTWVLDERRGVCDELTNLFISLNRALGIPARFVSGLSYTNDEIFEDNWGPHGWAEVYFPSVGWVPFDVTYGEYGYLDAGHIKLKDSLDSKETSIEYSGYGNGFRIESSPLDFEVGVLETNKRGASTIGAALDVLEEEVGFGSYNLATLTLTNKQDHYVSTRVDLGRTAQLSYESESTHNILLKPYEEREVEFLIKVADDLETGYQYTFPITAYTRLSDPAKTEFSVVRGAQYYDESIFEREEEQEDTPQAMITCDVQEVVVESATLTCEFAGSGSGNACIDGACEHVTLPATMTREVSRDDPGAYAIKTTYEGTSHYTTINFLDETRLEIQDVEVSREVGYDESATLSFTIAQESVSEPESLAVTIRGGRFSEVVEQGLGAYEITFFGRQLKPGENNITITARYEDVLGEEKVVQEQARIALTNLTTAQQVMLWLREADGWLRSLF